MVVQAVESSPAESDVVQFEKSTNFWAVTTNNEVIFPRWDELVFSGFWWAYIEDESRFALMSVGRGGGKTYQVCFKEVYRAITCYQQVKASGKRYSGPQWHLMFVFPTEENAQPAKAMLAEIIPQVPGFAPDGTLNHRRRGSDISDWRLFGENELLITVYSSFDASTLRGKSADQLVVDEAFKIPREDFVDVLIPIADRPGRPDIGGFITASSTPDTEDEKDPWFDRACDEADPDLPDVVGYFSEGWKLWSAPFTVNPEMSKERFERILKQKALNPKKWQRERLAIRGIKIKTGDTPARIFTRGMVEACWYKEQPSVPKRPAAALDLAFGAEDSLARIWYDELTGTVFDLEIWLPKEQREMGITPKAYDAGMVDLFTTTGARFAGLQIVYDANSENHQPVEHLVPRHLRTLGVKKNQHKKYGLVKLLEERFALVENGRNTSLRLPHPDATWLTPRQREAFLRLYREIEEFEVFYEVMPSGQVRVKCGKSENGTDDAIDALLLLMELTKPLRPAGQKPLRRMRG